MRKIIAACLMSFLFPVICTGEYYQWVDENGVLRFGDAPCVGENTPENLEIQQKGKAAVRLGGGAVDSECIRKLKTICIQMKDADDGLFREKLMALKDQCEPEPLVNAVFDVLQYEKDRQVIRALSRILSKYTWKQPETAYALIRGLENESPVIQSLAKKNLMGIDHQDAILPIVNALKVKSGDQRKILADCLFNYYLYIEYEPAALTDLIELMKDESNIAIKSKLIAVLGWSGDPAVVGHLVGLLEFPDFGVRARTASAIVTIKDGKDYPPALEAKLISGLETYGDQELATTFLNHGTAKMNSAAKKWAKDHGYAISTFRPNGLFR